MKSRIMYIERKVDGVGGPGRIGRVTFSQTMRSVYYGGRRFQKTKSGFKSNYFDAETGEEYWISGCKKDGSDHLYAGTTEIDDDVREEYWRTIRKMPSKKQVGKMRVRAKY